MVRILLWVRDSVSYGIDMGSANNGVTDEWHLLERKILFYRHSCEGKNPVAPAFRESPKALDSRFRGDDERETELVLFIARPTLKCCLPLYGITGNVCPG